MIIKNDFDISSISYIRVGGIVKKYIVIETLNELKYLSNRYIAISNTSKILFCFDYFPYNIVKLSIDKIIIYEDSYFIYSGCPLIKVYKSLQKMNLSGFEELATIPGLIGGSIVNNSSFLHSSISDNILKVLVFEDGKFIWLNKSDCNFSYRNSSLKKENFVVIGALFKKVSKDKNEIESTFLKALEYRKKHQDEYKNTLGSTFKNSHNITIGKVIDDLGYKGYAYSNNVEISKKHGNFILIKNKTHYLEVYSFIDYLKRLLYYYLEKNISLEIILITDYGYEN